MWVLGLDIATVTGWAILSAGRYDDSGIWKCPAKPAAVDRPLAFRAYLIGILDSLKEYGGEIQVAFEDVKFQHGGRKAQEVRGGLVAIMRTTCADYGVPVVGFTVGAVKKRATDCGRATKLEMVVAAERRWGLEDVDDNEADALWTAQCGWDQWNS